MATTGKPMTINREGKKSAHVRRKEQNYRKTMAEKEAKTKKRRIELERERLAQDLDEFLSNGGKIDVLEPCGTGTGGKAAWEGES